MINLEELPQITDGSDKQKMFADSIRLQFISYIEQNMSDNFLEDFKLVLDLRTNYRWWIDRVYKIDPRNVKSMISAVKTAVKKHGSMEGAKKAQAEAIQKQKDHFQYSKILGGILDS
jgi:hypothetical protein